MLRTLLPGLHWQAMGLLRLAALKGSPPSQLQVVVVDALHMQADLYKYLQMFQYCHMLDF